MNSQRNGTWGAFAGDTSRWLDGRLRTLVGIRLGRQAQPRRTLAGHGVWQHPRRQRFAARSADTGGKGAPRNGTERRPQQCQHREQEV